MEIYHRERKDYLQWSKNPLSALFLTLSHGDAEFNLSSTRKWLFLSVFKRSLTLFLYIFILVLIAVVVLRLVVVITVANALWWWKFVAAVCWQKLKILCKNFLFQSKSKIFEVRRVPSNRCISNDTKEWFFGFFSRLSLFVV